MKKRKKHTKKKTIRFKLIIALGILIAVLIPAIGVLQNVHGIRIASSSPKDSLQLETFYPTKQPTTPPTSPTIATPPVTQAIPTGVGGMCPTDTGIRLPGPNSCSCGAYLVDCENQHCAQLIPVNDYLHYGTDCSKWGWCDRAIHSRQGDGWYCMSKPVIYLYPEQNTLVNVQVKTAGKVVVSDPLYPAGGWQRVLAHPNGTLDYQGKSYTELFYETESSSLSAPQEGIIIPTQNLEEKLREEITLLGLTKVNEQQEFLDWWVPRLQALHSPYILFSVLDASEKARVDNVEILPKPDTFTDFIAYFKPLQKIENVEPLVITPAPQRLGFTAIEWGGVIDKN